MSEAAPAISASHIEGGVDAIVVGADFDGLVAAALLGKAGLRTILFEDDVDIGGTIRKWAGQDSIGGVDGEHLVYALDPQVIDDLDLYRHGVGFAARRLDTTYFFKNGDQLTMDGDLALAAQQLLDRNDGTGFESFLRDLLEVADIMRPLFVDNAGGHNAMARLIEKAPENIVKRLRDFSLSSIEAGLDAYLPDGLVKSALYTEAAFRGASAPHEAFGFLSLVRRFSGEIAGLSAAIAFPEGGVYSLITALATRRTSGQS